MKPRKSRKIPTLSEHHVKPLDLMQALFAAHKQWGPNLIDNVEREMLELLRAEGLPAEATYRDQMRMESQHGVGSAVWYASRIISELANLRESIRRGDANWIAHDGIQLGLLLREASSVVPHAAAFDIGIKQYAALNSGRDDMNRKHQQEAEAEHQRWRTCAGEIWQNSPKLSATRCAEFVVDRLALDRSTRTVRRAIAPLRPQEVGHAR